MSQVLGKALAKHCELSLVTSNPTHQKGGQCVSGWGRMQTTAEWVLKQGPSKSKQTNELAQQSIREIHSSPHPSPLRICITLILLEFWFFKLFLSAFILSCLHLPKIENYLDVNTDLDSTEESNSRPAVQLANPHPHQMQAVLLIKRQVLHSSHFSLVKK